MEVDGFRTECRLDDGQTLFLLAWLEIDGSFPRSAHFANRYRLRSSNSYGGPLMRSRIFKKERAAIGSLWPLKVGRDVQYSTKFETRGIPGAPSYGRTSSHVKVESTDSIIAGDSEWRTFVIVVRSKLRFPFQGGFDRSEHTRRLWYAPELGMVVKEEFEFGDGSRSLESKLLSAQLPDGTQILEPHLARHPPAASATSDSPTANEVRLRSVQGLLDQGLIAKEEAAEKRQEILEDL